MCTRLCVLLGGLELRYCSKSTGRKLVKSQAALVLLEGLGVLKREIVIVVILCYDCVRQNVRKQTQ